MKTFCNSVEQGDKIDNVLQASKEVGFENFIIDDSTTRVDGKKYTTLRISSGEWECHCLLYYDDGIVTERIYSSYPSGPFIPM